MTASDWRPSVGDIATILRARTREAWDGASEGSEEGDEAGAFGTNTTPTADQVDEFIELAQWDVQNRVGVELPKTLWPAGKRVVALRAASEIERAYIPEQAEPTNTLYQTLRLSFNEEVEQLQRSMQYWVLAHDLEEGDKEE